MDLATMTELLGQVRRIALGAGRAIREISLQPADVTAKADGTPLTRADLASQEVILAALAALEPTLPILSEEGDLEDLDQEAWRTYWCVDPLDGTKEFVQGLGDYTVNIALVESYRPTLGVVGVPAAEVLYFAARGMGAFRVDRSGKPQRIRPSGARQPRTAVVSRTHLSPETKDFLARLNVTETVQRGSAVKMCAVAEGTADIYPRLGPTSLWDTAAGAAIALEAGCRVLDLRGRDLTYDPLAGLTRPGFVVCPAGMELPGLTDRP